MISFYSIEKFRISVTKLLKKPKDGYLSVKNDICQVFDLQTIEEIRINREMIYNEKVFTIVKLRVEDSNRNLSKSNGYRLLYLVLKNEAKVILLDVFPKQGKLAKSNITNSELKYLLANYISETKSNSLVEHDITKDLEELPKEEN